MTISDEKLMSDLKCEDLQEQHREIAETIGVDNLIKLSKHFGGTGIYIPQQRELVKLKVYSLIKAEYNGTNIKELAGKYNVSESTVYNIVRDILMRGADKRDAKYNIPGQTSITDWMETMRFGE